MKNDQKIAEVIEMIECAKINADNIRTAGLVMIDVVQMQLDSALAILQKEATK